MHMTHKEIAPDAARRYHCPACGHKMTYGLARCDACTEEAPVYNLPNFWRGFAAALFACAIFALWAWFR